MWFRFARFLCRIFCKAFFKVRFYGLENVPRSGGFLLTSNHQSYIDPVLCGIVIKRDLYFLARDTLFKNKFFGPLIRSVHSIPVKRGQGDTAAMKAVIEKLNQQQGVCLFPEGTRTTDGAIADLKPGFTLLCKKANAPVLPTVIDGAFESWPKGKKFPKFGSEITVSYGAVIPAQQIKQTDPRQMAQILTDTLRKMLNDSRQAKGKELIEY